MTRRTIVLIAAVMLAFVFTVFDSGVAFEGTSLYDNVAPKSQVHGLSERYPSGRYGLDHHSGDVVKSTSIGIGSVPTAVDTDAAGAGIMHQLASAIWDLCRFISSGLITLFTFAFSLDLISGSDGALAPIAHAVRNLYDALGTEWLGVMIALLGGWVTWRALVQREITRTFGQLLTSLVMVLLAMLIITQPAWTIGGASQYSNELANALLGAINGDDTAAAKTAAADALHETLIGDPWIVLNFGGMEHCVDADNKPVKPHSKHCRTRINHKRKYADRWLKSGAPNSKARTLEYEALRDGKAPTDPFAMQDAGVTPTAFNGYRLSDADKPAVDIQQQLAGERLGLAIVIFIGSLGAWLLIGSMAIGVIVAKLVALLLFALAVVMLLAAIFPGAGHRAYRGWAERLLVALTLAIWYALILAIVLAISRALTGASANLGWLMAFGLQAAFWWAVFLNRKQLVAGLIRALPGATGASERDRSLGDRARGAYYTGKMAAATSAAIAGGVAGLGRRSARSARLVGSTAAEGVRTGVQMAAEHDANGHTEAMVAAGSLSGRAIDELERDHAGNQQRLSEETARRTRIASLTARAQMAREGAVPEAEGLALTPQEERELVGLQRRAMATEDYEGLRDSVHDVDRRREDSGARFDEQVTARAAQIAERDANRSRNGDSPSPRDAIDMEGLADRARHYSEEQHPRIFGDDDAERERDRTPAPAPNERRERLRLWRKPPDDRDDW